MKDMKAVIFDMDGLMFDTERLNMQAWDYAGEKMGIGKAGYMNLKTMGLVAAMVEKVWLEEFGERYDSHALSRYTDEFLNKYYEEHKIPVKQGLYVLLDYLKTHNFKVALASSTDRSQVEKNLKDAEVYEYFDAIICGDMVEKSKPEPDIFLQACKKLGVKPEECYALEDSRNGLLSAYRAGCKTIMVPDLWQPDEEIEQILTAKLEDLEVVKEYIERKNN